MLRLLVAGALVSLTTTTTSVPPVSARGLTSLECVGGMAGPYPCRDVDLASFVPLPLMGLGQGNDIWGWTDPETGRDYAIMGTSVTTGFVDVTDPENPVVVGVLPTRGVPDFIFWRDIKVDGNYAFIVSELSFSGLQVFDLTRLRGQTSLTVFSSDATYDEFSHAHNVAINPETHYAYVAGSNTCSNGEERGGLHMIDISNPLDPRFAGCALTSAGRPSDPTNYVHDVQCVVYRGPDAAYRGGEICFGANESVVAIYDVTDKSAPVVLSLTGYPTAGYTHQGWLTGDHRYFLFGDELDELDNEVNNTTTYIMDVADLNNPDTPQPFTHETTSIDHNLYVDEGLVYESNYTAGLRILEFDDTSLAAGELREVAFFDTYPLHDSTEFAGTWSNYPFFKSGTVVVSAIDDQVTGMFVLRPRLEAEQLPPAPSDPEPPPGGTAPTGSSPIWLAGGIALLLMAAVTAWAASGDRRGRIHPL